MKIDTIFCSECGFPENGTDKEKSLFHAKRVMKKSANDDANKKIKSARNTLYVIAGITFVFGLIFYFSTQDIATLVTNMVLAIIYIILGSWTNKKPMVAILLGLLLYLTTIIISAIVEPSTLVRGIIFKVLIIAYLGKGVYSASSIKQ